MATGNVKWFDAKRGYGFITPDGGGPEVFVHHTAIIGKGYRNLFEGQKVRFELSNSDKGPKATDVALA